MHPDEVKQLLSARLEGCSVDVSGDGSHFDLVVVGELFSGLSPVRRQQQVYAALREEIASGAIHAVNMKTYTPDEWSVRAGS